LFVSCSADIENTYAVAEVIDWGEDKQLWSIDYRICEGDPYEKSLWKTLLNETWELKFCLNILINIMAVGAGYFSKPVIRGLENNICKG
jgi:phage terminase large subunit GpA-like protein